MSAIQFLLGIGGAMAFALMVVGVLALGALVL